MAVPKRAHPLASSVRTLRERKKNEAEVREGIAPVRAFLDQHVDHLLRPEAQGLHKRTLITMVRNSGRLGFSDEDVKAWSDRYDACQGDNPFGPPGGKTEKIERYDHNRARSLRYGRYLGGDYPRSGRAATRAARDHRGP